MAWWFVFVETINDLAEEIRILKKQNYNLKQELPDGHHWKDGGEY